jgi:hypothetical protein
MPSGQIAKDQLDSSDQSFNHAKAGLLTVTAWREELDYPGDRGGDARENLADEY